MRHPMGRSFRDRDKKGMLYLVTVSGDSPIDLKSLQKKLEVRLASSFPVVGCAFQHLYRQIPSSANLRFAPEDLLQSQLCVPQGSVSPLALLNRPSNASPIVFVVDQALTLCQGRLWVHPSDNALSCGIKWPDLERIVRTTGVEMRFLDLRS